jgi:hypothetical protein
VGASTSGPALSITRGGLLGLLQSGPNGVFLTFPLRELLLPPIPATHDGGEKALCRSAEKSPAAPLPPMPPTFAAPLGPVELGKEPETPSQACLGGGGRVTKTSAFFQLWTKAGITTTVAIVFPTHEWINFLINL